MKEHTFYIKNKLGLHARPAALFVKTCNKYKSQIRVFKDNQEVDGKSIMGLLTLGAGCGSVIKIVADGDDEDKLLSELYDLVEIDKFGEE